MIKTLTFILAFGTIASASEAVKELNYSLGIDARDSHFGDNLSAQGYGVFGSITAPVSEYVGIHLNTGYSESETSQDIDSTYKYISSDIFLRDSGIGKVGLGFSYAKDEVDANDIVFNVKSKSAFTYVDYYINNNFTLSSTVGYYDLNLNIEHQGYNSFVILENSYDTYYDAGALWYFQDDTKAGFLYNSDFDDVYRSYAFSLSYQPELFKNSIETSLSYTMYDKHDDNTLVLSISYHFMRATLKDRDRTYR